MTMCKRFFFIEGNEEETKWNRREADTFMGFVSPLLPSLSIWEGARAEELLHVGILVY